ncbi:MAG: hypothetical protein IKC03_00450 [Oscillospiraceae bacterium]|nr:hypothetical protein [Oscillospiraceae bacterium]
MSYVIEYDRLFIQSGEGFTPCWLSGENNVWVPTYKTRYSQRRARSWCLFYNLLGVTENEIVAAVQPSLGQDNQHWKKNGKWLNDASLLRWIHNGCMKASTIEDILRLNQWQSLYCYLREYGQRDRLPQHVKTTAEFDEWICAARNYLQSNSSCRPVIELGDEPLRHVPADRRADDPVVVKRDRMYLTKIEPNGYTFSIRLEDALVMRRQDAEKFLISHHISAQLLPEYVKLYNFTVHVKSGIYADRYVQKCGRRNIYFCKELMYAYRYATEQSAKAVQDRLLKRGIVSIIENVK